VEAAPLPGSAVPPAAVAAPAFSAWVAAHGDVTDTTAGRSAGDVGPTAPAAEAEVVAVGEARPSPLTQAYALESRCPYTKWS
jgi:hypothetical protein